LPRQAEALAAALGPDWYAEPDHIRRQIEAGRAFNVIQMSTALKVDIYAAQDDFHLSQLERATKVDLAFLGGMEEVPSGHRRRHYFGQPPVV
jgi:hypothetical protein